ncbi:MAG: hypothetical protein ACHBN1_13885 [Heteroscytonema crispum UTEX LB 1556]
MDIHILSPFPFFLFPFALRSRQSSGKRHCDPWGDPKTAVADLPRARSEPGGIFPTADASADSPFPFSPVVTIKASLKKSCYDSHPPTTAENDHRGISRMGTSPRLSL